MPSNIEQITKDFWSSSGRDLAYQSLIETAKYASGPPQKEAISFLLSVLSCLKDKSEAWDAVKHVLNSRSSSSITGVLQPLGPAFKDLPDKNEAWQKLHRLTLSRDIEVKEYAAFAIGPAFAYIPEEFQDQAMKDLFRLARNSHEEVQESVAMSLKFAFPYLPDRNKAWDILVRMALEDDCDVGHEAARSFSYVFPHVEDKLEAWDDLFYVIDSSSFLNTYEITSSIFHSYSFYPEKQSGYYDLMQLVIHEDRSVRETASISIGYVFQHFPDKVKILAQKELMGLLDDERFDFKGSLIISVGNAFSSFPDKEDAWEILHQYVNNSDESIRKGLAFSIGDACPDLPFPEKSLRDLLILAQDESGSVRMGVAHSLGFIYPHIGGDSEILDCLVTLTGDKHSCIRNRANYSLGKIYVYKASKTKDERVLGDLVEKAVVHFEKAAIEDCYFNPAKFCYLFYRSFSEVILKKQISRQKIEKYLIDARSVAEDSTNKKRLVKVIENLSDALFAAQAPHKMGIESKVELVTYCRKQCHYAEYLMDKTKGNTPNLNHLFHKIKPYFHQNIKKLIDDVKEKAEAACREAKGTEAEYIACSVNKEIQGWGVESQEQMGKNLDNVIFSLKSKIPDISENKLIIAKIDEIKSESKVENQMMILSTLIGFFPSLSLYADISEIKENSKTMIENMDQLIASIKQIEISLEPSIKEEIQVAVGLSGLVFDAKRIITIPVQEISYPELRDDLQKYSDKMLDIAKLPVRLKDKIMGYIRKNGNDLREY
ncbi:HEAT repeat domain-containing protein [Methanolobus sp. WCC4]|uniref:HEAT repeat domain-containing protein n=1 Tax=Methanolobus sp. WCC4 TaxID=3125784 RepID=UPI0030F79D41